MVHSYNVRVVDAALEGADTNTYFIRDSSINSTSLEYQESLGWQMIDLIDLNNDLNYLLLKPSYSNGLHVTV